MEPLARVLANVAIIPVYHHAEHIALNNLWISDDLELSIALSREAPTGGALVALAVVSQPYVWDFSGPAITEGDLKGVATRGSSHYTATWAWSLCSGQLVTGSGS